MDPDAGIEKRAITVAGDKRPWYLVCGAYPDGHGACSLYRPEKGKRYGLAEVSDYGTRSETGGIMVVRAADKTTLILRWKREKDDDCCEGGERDIWGDSLRVERVDADDITHLGKVTLRYSRAEGRAKSSGLQACLTKDGVFARIAGRRYGRGVYGLEWRKGSLACLDMRKERVELAARRALAGEPLEGPLVVGFDKLEFWLVRNASYARHGYPFRSKRIGGWFYGPKARYPNLAPDPSYKDARLTRVDRENAKLVKSLERMKGVRFVSDCEIPR